jgi:hypothetical protein
LFIRYSPTVTKYRSTLWIEVVALVFAGFCKPNAFLISVFWLPDVIASLRDKTRGVPRCLALLLAAAPLAGLVCVSGWQYRLTGSPLAWANVQSAWGAELFAAPLQQFNELLTQPMLIGRWGWDTTLVNWLIVAGAWISTGLLLRRRQFTAAAFLFLTSMLSFANFGVWVHGKHMTTTFPYFAGYGLLRLREIHILGIVAVLAALLALAGFMDGAGFNSLRS